MTLVTASKPPSDKNWLLGPGSLGDILLEDAQQNTKLYKQETN